MLFSNILLAFSSSVDSFGIGLTYGLRSIKFSNFSYIVLFTISLFVNTLSVIIGNQINRFISPFLATLLGSFLIILMGIIIVFQVLKKQKSANCKSKSINVLKYFSIASQIIKSPMASDLDNSNTIDIKEAFFLATTLSIDSFCIGVCSGISGTNIYMFPILVSGFQIIFLFIGELFSKIIKKHSNLPDNIWNLISGILLILIGFFRLFI